MRRFTSRLHLLLALALVAVLAALAGGVSSARADDGHSAKVEGRLAAQANSKGPEAELQIILRGDDTDKLFRKYAKHGEELPLVGGVATSVKVKDLDKLAADPDVSFVAADPPVAPQGTVDYSKLTTSYPFADNAQKVWVDKYDGSGVGIAVIDSGVAPVSDFSGRLVQVTMPGQPWGNDDTYGHGSLVAGVAAGKSSDGKFIGIAPGATVYALNVNNPAGVNSSDVIAALQWVYTNAHTYNIRVVNLSLAETLPSSYLQSTLDLAVERVWAAGVTVVVAGGNGGVGAVDFAPANDPLALSVGGTDNMGTNYVGDDVLASWSALGTTVNGYAKPEMVAPGRRIASVLPAGTYLDSVAPAANRVAPGYATISGTSFSAPQVAAAAALVLQRHPGWSPDQVKWALVQKAKPISAGLLRTLDAVAAETVSDGDVGRANQGVLALVCAPGATCLTDNGGSTAASNWDSSTWNSSTWNSSTWNSSTWNSSTWNSSTWNSSTWNSSTWNSSTWNSSTWNSSTWNSSTWNSSTWNSFTWNFDSWQ
jgi:serine protease AprX